MQFLSDKEDSDSLCLYRQGIILKILFALAQFKYRTFNSDTPILKTIKNKIIQTAKEYKNYPSVTEQEKIGWLNQNYKIF